MNQISRNEPDRKGHSPLPAVGLRTATTEDFDALNRLRLRALDSLLGPRLRREQWLTMMEYTPLDAALIEDGSYYLVEVDGQPAASGGWSRRAGLCRTGESAAPLHDMRDPERDAAAIRGMYTDPGFARLGLGSLLLSAAETAARLAGFRRAELLATPAGRDLYLARGWREREEVLIGPDHLRGIVTFRMEKVLAAGGGRRTESSPRTQAQAPETPPAPALSLAARKQGQELHEEQRKGRGPQEP